MASKLKCCCARPDCPHLERNTATLEELERDVEIAARLGQALLERHESYKSEVELDRGRMLSKMEKLERCKLETEAENSRLSAENNDLTDQLDCLNQAIAESDTQIQTLTATLERTQLEAQSLAVCASRATLLEEELHKMEKDQARLQEEITVTQEGEKNAIQRWKKAENGLENLHEQLDQMENETREERERTMELSKRMQRSRADGNESILAGGSKPSNQNRNKIGMASHFVGDILQENAKLQRFVVELKELLQNSDEEAQNLREQMAFHRSLDQILSAREGHQGGYRLPLSEELRFREPARNEVHVHHHYHNSITASLRSKPRTGRSQFPAPHQQRNVSAPPPFMLKPQKKKPTTRKAAKRTRPTGFSTPVTRATNAPALSSPPSSPQSGYRTSSIFDPFDEIESSQPSSPENSNLTSPQPKLRDCESLSYPSVNAISEIMEQRKRLVDLPGPRLLESVDDSEVVSAQDSRSTHQEYGTYSDPILIKDVKNLCDPNHRHDSATNSLCDNPSIASLPSPSDQTKIQGPHDSLISIFSTDYREPSEVASTSTCASLSSHPLSSAGIIFSTTAPIISKTNVVIPKASMPNDKTSLSLLSSAASSSVYSGKSEPLTERTPEVVQKRGVSILPKFPVRLRAISVGRRVGSWVHKRPSAQSKDFVNESLSSTSHTTVMARSPGVNQIGPIFGLRPPNPAPTSVHVQGIDHVLLQETLLE